MNDSVIIDHCMRNPFRCSPHKLISNRKIVTWNSLSPGDAIDMMGMGPPRVL